MGLLGARVIEKESIYDQAYKKQADSQFEITM
jgi:hypothetical protein